MNFDANSFQIRQIMRRHKRGTARATFGGHSSSTRLVISSTVARENGYCYNRDREKMGIGIVIMPAIENFQPL